MLRDVVREELKYRLSAVIIVSSDACYEASIAINESMNNNLPPNQTCWKVRWVEIKVKSISLTMLAVVMTE